MSKVEGYREDLPGGRSVFVGTSADTPGWFFRFISATGEETKLRLSEEAVEAMIRLYNYRRRVVSTGLHYEWRFVDENGKVTG